MIDKMNLHYSFTNPASVYDEESLTALELAGRQGAKINEVIEDQNALRTETEEHLTQQDNTINARMDEQDSDINNIRTVTVPADVEREMQKRIDDGTFDAKIDESLNGLNERVDNLLGSMTEGSTTMDAEVIDMRVGENGITYVNAGESVRQQIHYLRDQMVNAGVRYLPAYSYNFRDVSGASSFKNGLTTLEPIGVNKVRVVKTSSETGSNYAGVYIRIEYGDLDELKGEFEVIYDSNLNMTIRLTPEISDWGDVGSIQNIIGKHFNLYDTIVKHSLADFYKNRSYLYLSILHYDVNGISDTYDMTFQVKHYLENSTVVANEVTHALRSELSTHVGSIPVNKTDYLFRDAYATMGASIVESTLTGVKLVKNNNGNGSPYAGFYIRLKYNSIDELKGVIKIQFTTTLATNLHLGITPTLTDWGGDNAFRFSTPSPDAKEVSLNVHDLIYDRGFEGFYSTAGEVYVFLLHYKQGGHTEQYEINMSAQFYPDDIKVIASDCVGPLDERIRKLESSTNVIAFIGDSLTAQQYQAYIDTGDMQKNTYAIGGEGIAQIFHRTGVTPWTASNTSLTAGANILQTNDSGLFRQGLGNVNPVSIAGIKGNISVDSNNNYIFTPEEEIETTPLFNPCIITYPSSFPHAFYVFWVGTNNMNGETTFIFDSWKQILSVYPKALILGITHDGNDGNLDKIATLDALGENAFGTRFLKLHDWIVENGLRYAGLTPTATDTEYITAGKIPPSLLSDAVHFNEYGKKCVAHLVEERLKMLCVI